MPKTKQAVEQAANLKIYTPQLDVLEERLLEWTEKQEIFQALVVKATRYGVPIFEGCYGTSTNDSGVKLDTIFPVASNTKPVIATLLMILQESGYVEMGDRVSRFIPEYTGGGKDEISLVHFLTHTSGVLEDYWSLAKDYIRNELKMELPYGKTEEEREAYNLRLKHALGLPEDYDWEKIFEEITKRINLKSAGPRTIMSYCSYGYGMLKEVICKVTGESIDSYAQRVLFEPLGMIDSHWVLPKEKWSRVLGRGERCAGYGWINSAECYTSESGGGGLKTTVNDMTNFAQMILGEGRFNNKHVLSPASVYEMTKNYNSEFKNPFDAWGLGWNYRGTKVDDAGILRSGKSIEHGGAGGHRIMIDPVRGITVIAYYGLNDGNPPDDVGRINNMVIAACE